MADTLMFDRPEVISIGSSPESDDGSASLVSTLIPHGQSAGTDGPRAIDEDRKTGST